jgi:fatty-acyl-CoA synthase
VVPVKGALELDELFTRCRAELAGYKQPKEIRVVSAERITRSTTGKVQRKLLEDWVASQDDGQQSKAC